MPRIWSDTIDDHRRQVSDAVVDAAAELAREHGPLSVTMSAVAQRAGIGRATLYKYFPDVEAILLAWHRRMFHSQLARLQELATASDTSLDDLIHVALGQRHHLRDHVDALGGRALVAMPDAVSAEVVAAVAAVVAVAAERGEVRRDIDATTLAAWLVQQIHVSGSVPDADLATLLRGALAAPSRARRAAR